jgi:BirA family biotin operon repressor/biotin-[acetyl-CoA-carboxylase] ligase
MMTAMTMTPLNARAIIDSLSASALAMFTVGVYDSVGSTNDVVRECLSADDSHSTAVLAVLAEEQTQGRGRRGRRWHSPPGANLYLSLGWRFHGPVGKLSCLSLAIGAMLAEAIARDCGVDLALKWPNDLYHGERKLGGVLIELLGEKNSAIPIIAGIGLNVNMPVEDTEAIQRPWTDLSSVLGIQLDRNDLAARLINQLASGLTDIDGGDMGSWLERWRQRDFLHGRQVLVEGTPNIAGKAAGVDQNGALLVSTETGQSVAAGGEATLLEIGVAG